MTALPYGLQPTTYRLPDATRLGRAQLQVTDLAQSLDFYTRVLGFRLLSQQGGVAALGSVGDDRTIL
ncbi:MAG: VOC family protein, partial [Gemmatimonadaceae bacterium]|nr:VOC family protein [Gemmatimonadaceae bacterium]